MRKSWLTATALALILALSSAIRAHAATEITYRVSAGDILSTYYKAHGPEEELWAYQMITAAYTALVSYNNALGVKYYHQPEVSVLFCPPVAPPKPDQLLTLLKDGVDPNSNGAHINAAELFEDALLEVLMEKYPCKLTDRDVGVKPPTAQAPHTGMFDDLLATEPDGLNPFIRFAPKSFRGKVLDWFFPGEFLIDVRLGVPSWALESSK